MTKKILVALIAVAMLFAFTACEQQGYKIPTGITVSTTKTSYLAGSSADASSITAVLEYSDGSTKSVPGTDLMIDDSNLDSGVVSVSYSTASGNLIASFNVTVYKVSEVTGVAISELPATAKATDTTFTEVPAVATLPDGTTADVEVKITTTAISGAVGSSVKPVVSAVNIGSDSSTNFYPSKVSGLDNWSVTIANPSAFDEDTIASLAVEYVNTTTPEATAGTYYVDDVVTYKVYAVDGSGNRRELSPSEYGVIGGATLPASFNITAEAGKTEYKLYLVADPTKTTASGSGVKAPAGKAWVESVSFTNKEGAPKLAATGGTLSVSNLTIYYNVNIVGHGGSAATFTPSAANCVITNDTWAANTSENGTVFTPSIMVKVGKGDGAWTTATAAQLVVAGTV